MCLVLAYTETLISTGCYFLSYFYLSGNKKFYWSVNCESLILDILRYVDSIYIIGYLVLPYKEIFISTDSHLFSYFLLISKLYVLSLWIMEDVLNMSRSLSIILFEAYCNLLKVLCQLLCKYLAFSMVCKLSKPGLQL